MSDAGKPEILKAPKGMRWPGDRHVAVVFNVAYEAWTEQGASAIGPMGNPLRPGVFDLNADSYGRYGANAGIRRLMRILDRAGIAANVYVSGVLAERDPEQVRTIAQSGHEIVTHGYAQDLVPASLTAAEDEDYIRKATDGLAAVIGARPSGWISPRATPGDETFQRLIRHGYTWQGDALDDDLPYLQRYPEGDLVAVPLTIEINDLSHAMRWGRTPRQFVEIFDETMGQLLRQTDDVVILDVLCHAHCYGRPQAAWAYDEIVRKCADRDDIWVTTRGRIAEHFLAALRDGRC